MFSAPIPGQSLTSEPKNSTWENPPQIAEPEEALLWHLEKFDNPKKVEAVVGLLGLGLDLVTMTEGLLRTAVADGRHSVDVSLIIAPVIHEYLKGIADTSGVDYEEGLDSDSDEMSLSTVQVGMRKKEIDQILKDVKSEEDIDLSGLEEPDVDMEDADPMVSMDKEQPQEEKPMGLMTRRTV
jgi:hypothetical protein